VNYLDHPFSFISLVNKPVFHQSPKGYYFIPGFDLLPLKVIAGIERFRYLIQACFKLENFCCELLFKIKSATVQGHILRQLAFEHFVSGFHIRKNVVIKDICAKSKNLIRQHILKEDRTACCAQESCAIHYIRFAFFDRLE
jgi:hypothetical protein